MRAVVGSLNWASREGRPDAAASASLSASKFLRPIVQDLIDLNKAIQTIKPRPDLNIKMRSVPVDKLAWGVMTDSSFDNAGDGKSQGACGVLAFHEDLQKGYPCAVLLDDMEKWAHPARGELDPCSGDPESSKGAWRTVLDYECVQQDDEHPLQD